MPRTDATVRIILRMEKLEIFNTPTRFIGDSQTISLLVAHAFFKVNQLTGMIHCNLAGYPHDTTIVFLLRPAAPDSDLQSSLTEPLNAERTMALSSEASFAALNVRVGRCWMGSHKIPLMDPCKSVLL